MSGEDFVTRYGGIYEHSPWVAARTEELLAGAVVDRESLANLMADCVDNASRDTQLDLIRAHPDLAGKAQVAGELTADSSEEQSKAGLDQCTAQEFESFQSLNIAYKEKFGFPFIMAVRESTRADILEAFAARIDNDYNDEFEAALQEIHKIARLRLAAPGDST
jgi:2-oxo-4-hydroxy-4-carboxy-5-ureidoimidazoline decarboxylase